MQENGNTATRLGLKCGLKLEFQLMPVNSTIECCKLQLKVFDAVFHFRVIHYFVGSSDVVILFAKSEESLQGGLSFQR